MTNYSVLKWTAFLVKRATFDVYVNMKVYKNINVGSFFILYIFDTPGLYWENYRNGRNFVSAIQSQKKNNF